MKEKESSSQLVSSSMMDTHSVLRVRLQSDKILERLRIFLTGKIKHETHDDKGMPVIQYEQIAKPKANDEGIHWVLNYVENLINPQVVQGNYDDQRYQLFIAEVHDGMIYNMMNNLHNWGIDEDDYEPIIDQIMNMIQPFISRLIDNKERESYAQTIQVRESSSVSSSGGLFKRGD